MKSLYPFAIYRYLHSLSLHKQEFAYLKLTDDCCVIDSDGDLARLGLTDLDAPLSIEEQFFPLIGVLPATNYALVLLNVNLPENR